MNIGMLWLDADEQRPLEEKIQRAADYYQAKYGRFPTTCLVNVRTLTEEKKMGKIVVKPVKSVLKNHFWLGFEAPTSQTSSKQK